MKSRFLAATIVSFGLCASFTDFANAREADVEVNLGALQKLSPNYQPVAEPRRAAQAPAPKPKPRYAAPRKPVAPVPQIAATPVAPAPRAPINAPLPANYNPAMFAPEGPSVKVTATGNKQLAPRHVAAAPIKAPTPIVQPSPAPVSQRIADVPPPPPAPMAAPVAPPAPLKPVDMPRRAPEMQVTKPANIPAPLPVPPASPPKLAAMPKAPAKLAVATPPAPPPPLVITPDDNEIKSNSKPLLTPKDALEAPQIKPIPAPAAPKMAAITPPAPPAPPALPPMAQPPMGKMALPPAMPAVPPMPPMPDLNKKIEAQTAKLSEQPKVAPLQNENSPLASLPMLPPPPAPPGVKDLPPLPTTKTVQTADLTTPPAPSQLPSLDKLFEKKDTAPALPPVATIANKAAVKVQTAGLPDVVAPAAPVAASSGTASIPYAEAEVEIPPSEQAKLQSIANIAIADKSAKVNISAYASGTDDQVALSLRTSFSRAVKIRKFFIDRNITGDRINVKALGNKSSSGVPDRVDVSVGKAG